MNTIGVVTKSNQMGTNAILIVTNTLRKVTLIKSLRNVDHIVKKEPNVIYSVCVVWKPSLYQVN